MIVADTPMGSRVDPGQELSRRYPDRLADAFCEVELFGDSLGVAVEHEDRALADHRSRVYHDDAQRLDRADDSDAVLFERLANGGGLVALSLVGSGEAVEVEPHRRLGKVAACDATHLDVEADEASLGVDECDVDVGRLDLVEASEEGIALLINLDVVDVLLEPRVYGPVVPVEDGFEVLTLCLAALEKLGIVLQGFLESEATLAGSFFTRDRHSKLLLLGGLLWSATAQYFVGPGNVIYA